MSTTKGPTEFVTRWENSAASERANYQLFLAELCDLLGVDRPDPSGADEGKNVYVFEKAVTFKHGDGSTSSGRIDLYKRGCFVCETKQGVLAKREAAATVAAPSIPVKKGHGVRGTKGWDDAMIAARGQAEGYVRALPDDNPPFLLVIDVGYSVELYADFSRLGKVYTPFPDALSHRLYLKDLPEPSVRDRLRGVWTDPLALDPSRRAAKVTRDIASLLAALAKSLEAVGHAPEAVAGFLMRCLFTLFAEDVKLIKDDAFTNLLKSLKGQARNLRHTLPQVWREMDTGTEFSPVLRQKLMRFNGGLFAETDALDLNDEQLTILTLAAEADWKDVEPAIFGTLLERALSPAERHKLGAHYTPRAYVERLVLPTLIEPLRDDWDAARIASLAKANAGDRKGAVAEAMTFLDALTNVRVLDPACGTGNFLYVAMARMKDLEGEVRDWLAQLGEAQMDFEGLGKTVDPHQFLGIEINPRAAAIADLVLWIGYLQWYFRTHRDTLPREPVLKAFDNIDNRDAVLTYDGKEPVTDDAGHPVSRWDGRTFKKHPVTGEDVPDEAARVPVYKYINPRKAEWPKADFVVGNPPYIGTRRIKSALGDEYVDALRAAFHALPETVDLVMYWWDHAAEAVSKNELRSFGFITTDSIVQDYSRPGIERHIETKGNVALAFAIADHPWVEAADGAAVQVAMTVGVARTSLHSPAHIGTVHGDWNEPDKTVVQSVPVASIGSRLTADAFQLEDLQANRGLCFQGVVPAGDGFKLSADELPSIGVVDGALPHFVRPYVIGRDLVQVAERRFIIDFFGKSEREANEANGSAFQRLMDRVLPERRQNKRASYRDKWWIFAEPRPAMRRALDRLQRFIVTPYTAKHRPFVFVPAGTLPDAMAYAIADSDAFVLGTLSSRPHLLWCLRFGGTLEDRPRYNSKLTFFPFPFPEPSNVQRKRIREIAEQLDAHRKRQQAAYPGLTLTDMYNVLDRLRGLDRGTGEPLTPKEKAIHNQGLVSVLGQLHDDLDAAVFDAYGWPADLTDEQILTKLVELNRTRADEEQRGLIRWLRPAFQNPAGGSSVQQGLDIPDTAADGDTFATGRGKKSKGKAAKIPWPAAMPERAKAVRTVLQTAAGPLSARDVAGRFARAKPADVTDLLETLVSLGQGRKVGADCYAV
ncbi:MAG TPA: DNA methyltransferase [Tepidisphaeraceae bacterium]|nr:DNA methyltransferase [Tepidisphaeraceae bacterium]